MARRVSYNHLISNKRECNNCFIKNNEKYCYTSLISLCKNTGLEHKFNGRYFSVMVVMAHIPGR